MENLQNNKNVLGKLVKAQEAIKQKYKLLQRNKANFEKVLDETFCPIVDPLEKLALEKKKGKQKVVKTATATEKSSSRNVNEALLEQEQFDDSESAASADSNETVRYAETDFETASEEEEEEEEEEENNKYLAWLSKGQTRLFDNTYGVRSEDDVMKIGDSPINFDKNHVYVQKKKYAKTAGLIELLFKMQPDSEKIHDSDIENYRQIVEATNAFRRKYQEVEPLRRSKSNKYKIYIAPFFDKSLKRTEQTKGSGLLPRYKIVRKGALTDYVYWDNPNELVDRLRLLVAELTAGNNSHTNEIQSIIEELREAGLVY